MLELFYNMLIYFQLKYVTHLETFCFNSLKRHFKLFYRFINHAFFLLLSSIPYIVPSDIRNLILEVSFLCIVFVRNHQRVGQILITSLDFKFISLFFLLTDCYSLLILFFAFITLFASKQLIGEQIPSVLLISASPICSN